MKAMELGSAMVTKSPFLTPFAARLMNRVDARWTASVSLAAFALSFFLRSRFTTDVDFIALVIPSLVQGVAMSIFFVSMVTLTLNGVPGQQVPWQNPAFTMFNRGWNRLGQYESDKLT